MSHNTALSYRTALRALLDAIATTTLTPSAQLADFRPQVASLDSLIYAAQVLIRDWEHLEREEAEINHQAELARQRAAKHHTTDAFSDIID